MTKAIFKRILGPGAGEGGDGDWWNNCRKDLFLVWAMRNCKSLQRLGTFSREQS